MTETPSFMKTNFLVEVWDHFWSYFQNIELKWSVHKIAFMYALCSYMEDPFNQPLKIFWFIYYFLGWG